MADVFSLKLHGLRGSVGVAEGLPQRGRCGGDTQHPAAAGDQLSVRQGIAGVIDGHVLRQGIRSGPVFLSRNGRPLRRTQVTAEVQSLAWDARVDESKCNPRCLRKLWQAAREDVERSVRLLAEQSYERMLDTEQLAVGWMEEASFAGREHRAESFRGHREEAAEAG